MSSDFSVTPPGFIAALVSTLAASGQQVGVAFLGKKYDLSTSELVREVFYLQAITLLFFGPFLDYYFVGTFATSWLFNAYATRDIFYMLLSCSFAVLVNYSQFMCISELSPTGMRGLRIDNIRECKPKCSYSHVQTAIAAPHCSSQDIRSWVT